jgi:hypothetical protein
MFGLLIPTARDLLWRIDYVLRAVLREAAEGEDVAEPGEEVDHVYYRLIKSELGLEGTAAARLVGREKLEKMEKFEQRIEEDRLRKLMTRWQDASKEVLDQAKADFLRGFEAALEERGIQFDPKDQPLLDQHIRRALLQATADPTLDPQVPRVKKK